MSIAGNKPFDIRVSISLALLPALASCLLACTPQTHNPEPVKSEDNRRAERVAEAKAIAKAEARAHKAKEEARNAPKEKIDLLSDANTLVPVNDPFAGSSEKIKMLKGKMGVPFDLGKGIEFKLGWDDQGVFTSKAGKELQTAQLDSRLGLYFGKGVCVRVDTTPGHCEQDGSMLIYYRRVNRSNADEDYCKMALRYEVRVPHFGALIDPVLLNQCQMGKTDCMDSLPSKQFDCKTVRDCSTNIADGLCCTVWEPVAYNKTFSKQLFEFRSKHCEEVHCQLMVESVGWNRPQCVQNKCVLNPDDRNDDLRALCL